MKVETLHDTLKIIFLNFLPGRTIKCDYRQPRWMTKTIKDKLKKGSKLTKIYFKNYKMENDQDNLNNNNIKWMHKTYIRFKRKTCLRDEWKTEWLSDCTKNVLGDIESFLKLD